MNRFGKIITVYVTGSGACVITGVVGAGLLNHWGFRVDYVTAMGLSWLVPIGIPSMGVASDAVLKSLGRPGAFRIWSSSGRAQGRKVPVNYSGGRTSHVFLSSLPLIGGGPAPPPELDPIPQTFNVSHEGTTYQIEVADLRNFLFTAWRRQRSGKGGLARKYWLYTARPPLSRDRYDIIMNLLLSVEGLVLEREARRSGRLALSPELTINALKGVY